jgi:hypothetical protein
MATIGCGISHEDTKLINAATTKATLKQNDEAADK